jgi:hypothetical protein
VKIRRGNQIKKYWHTVKALIIALREGVSDLFAEFLTKCLVSSGLLARLDYSCGGVRLFGGSDFLHPY